MVADRLQIPYNEEDLEFYRKWTRNTDPNSRLRKFAFMFALFKVKTNNHIQFIISGEFGQGKSTTAIILAKWDQIYTRTLLKKKRPELYQAIGDKNLRFSLEDNVIISPKDPASKAIANPKPWNSYVIDEGFLFVTSQEATTSIARKIRDNITQNRKKQPSMYWIYPNIFKMPSLILELMDGVLHKEKVDLGDVLIPSRVIQLKEKFDKERLMRYAKYPKRFSQFIRFHPSFVAKVKTRKVTGPTWKLYEQKYEKYKVTEEELPRANSQTKLFTRVEDLLNKNVIKLGSQKDLITLFYNLLKKKNANENMAQSLSGILADKFIDWQENKVASELTDSLSQSILGNAAESIDFIKKEDEEM